MTAQVPFWKRLRIASPRESLSARLTLTLLPLALIPLLILGLAAYQRSRALLRDQVVVQLRQATERQALALEDWRTAHEYPLWAATQTRSFADLAGQLAAQISRPRQADELRAQIVERLTTINERVSDGLYTGLMVVRMSDGLILAATPRFWEGDTITGIAEMPTTASHVTRDMAFSRATPISFFTVMPFPSDDPELQTALVGMSNDARITTLIVDVGAVQVPSSELYFLIQPDTLAVYDPLETGQIRIVRVAEHPVFDRIPDQPSGSLEFRALDGDQVLAYYRWVPDLSTAVVLEMPQSVAYTGLNSLSLFSLLLLVGAFTLVAVIVPLATRRSLRPLGDLTGGAERIATGDLRHRVPVTQTDEIGRLAAAFNEMADELQALYRGLEDRVEERTRQIRTAAEVARDAAAVREIDKLLDESVRLLSERFGFYHAAVFLLDDKNEYALLRAASSEGGRRMLLRGHKLAVGRMGIVGYVAESGTARIAADVGSDAAHFANPDLPETRSEMALPLRVGGRVTGVLDAQSKDENAFDADDLLIMQTVADQLAIAIENASLLSSETERATQRRKMIEVSRQISEQLGLREVLHRSTDLIRRAFGYRRVTLGLQEGAEILIRASSATAPTRPLALGTRTPVGQGILGRAVGLKAPVMIPDLAADERMPLLSAAETEPRALLAVPLMTRGQAIGALAVEQVEPNSLGEPDAEILETLSGILAVAIENTRLFEDMEHSLQQVDALYRRQTRDAWDKVLDARTSDPRRSTFEYALRSGPPASSEEEPIEVPIALRGESIGAIRAEVPQGPSGWDDVDKDVLQSVADEVATALEQIRLLDETQRRAAQLQTAAEIARDATGLLDPSTLLRRSIELIRARFSLYHVSVFLLSDDGEFAVVRESTGEAGREMIARGHRLAVGSRSVVGQVTRTGEHHIAQDTAQDPFHLPNPLLPDTRCELGLPLKIGQRVIGAIDLQHTSPHAFSEDDVAVLQILADQLSVALENARLFDETLHRARREQSILEISSKVRAASDVDSMMKTAIQELRQTLGARSARIRLAQEAGGAPGGDGHPSSVPAAQRAEEAA